MHAGIRDILVITTPKDHAAFEALLGDGSNWGVRFSYAAQPNPEGIAQSLIIARDFLDGEGCCLVLGDNLFHGYGFEQKLQQSVARQEGATIFVYWVDKPQRYGVLNFDETGKPESLVEKPEQPRSNWAVTGLYFYDSEAVGIADSLKPSARCELEITHVNQVYLERNKLSVEKLGRGFVWLDTGTHEALVDATEYVRAIENRQGLKISCVEEIAFRKGFIDARQLRNLAESIANTGYGRYLNMIAANG